LFIDGSPFLSLCPFLPPHHNRNEAEHFHSFSFLFGRSSFGNSRFIQNRSFILDATVRRLPYTLPGGAPRMSDVIASRATVFELA